MPRPYALVLTTNPAQGLLGEAVAERIRTLVPAATRQERWLAPGAALEWVWQATGPEEPRAVRRSATAALASHPVDVNVVPADPATRVKKLLAADMESTVIEQELIDELAKRAGTHGEISALTRLTMQGSLDFAASLKQRVGLLRGLPAHELDHAASLITVMPGARQLVAAMKAQGAHTALVSGGFTVFIEKVARDLGFDTWTGNELGVVNGQLSGTVQEPIRDAAAKRDTLLELAAGLDIDLSQTLAVGDGANDLAMLEAAGLAVAFRAKPAVRAAMLRAENGAVIDHADLTALLALQGLTIPA